MRITITIAINDLRVFLSEPANLLNLVVLPVIMSLVLGLALSEDQTINTVRVDLIDRDNSPESAQFIETLRQTNSTLRFCPMDDGQKVLDNDEEYDCLLDETDASAFEQSIERIENKTTTALIVIPEDYSEKLLDGDDSADIEYHFLKDITSGSGVLLSVEAAVRRINGAPVAEGVSTLVIDDLSEVENMPVLFEDDAARDEFTGGVFDHATQLWNEPPVRVAYSVAQTGEEESTPGMGFDQSVPGMATMFVMFTAFGGLGVLLQERQQWTLQRLITMPVSRAQLLGGKILTRFTTGMITFGIMVIVGFIVNLDWGSSPIAILLLMVSYTLCMTALTFAIAPFINSIEQADGITVMLSICLAAVGGAWWPFEIVPEFMQVVGRISPVAWAMDGFNQLIFYDAGLSDVLLDVGVLLAASVVLFIFGIMNFKYE